MRIQKMVCLKLIKQELEEDGDETGMDAREEKRKAQENKIKEGTLVAVIRGREMLPWRRLGRGRDMEEVDVEGGGRERYRVRNGEEWKNRK